MKGWAKKEMGRGYYVRACGVDEDMFRDERGREEGYE